MRDLTTLEVFTPEECASIAEEVLKLDPFLIDRGHFWTLGATAYQDDPKAYPAIANAFNRILWEAFSVMYGRVNKVLEGHFKVKIGYGDWGLGLPSFHVFDHTSNGHSGHPHIDEPFTRVNLSNLEWSKPFSFTLPVKMPSAGAGADFWWRFTGKQVEDFNARGKLPKPTFEPYELGKVYIHDGMTPHRIASLGPMPEGEERITLQGHGIHVDGGILVYF